MNGKHRLSKITNRVEERTRKPNMEITLKLRANDNAHKTRSITQMGNLPKQMNTTNIQN